MLYVGTRVVAIIISVFFKKPIHVMFDINLQVKKNLIIFQIWANFTKVFQIEILNKIHQLLIEKTLKSKTLAII